MRRNVLVFRNNMMQRRYLATAGLRHRGAEVTCHVLDVDRYTEELFHREHLKLQLAAYR